MKGGRWKTSCSNLHQLLEKSSGCTEPRLLLTAGSPYIDNPKSWSRSLGLCSYIEHRAEEASRRRLQQDEHGGSMRLSTAPPNAAWSHKQLGGLRATPAFSLLVKSFRSIVRKPVLHLLFEETSSSPPHCCVFAQKLQWYKVIVALEVSPRPESPERNVCLARVSRLLCDGPHMALCVLRPRLHNKGRITRAASPVIGRGEGRVLSPPNLLFIAPSLRAPSCGYVLVPNDCSSTFVFSPLAGMGRSPLSGL
ncbi:unnamed protein product [Pleuronectes platessa]|uniref:Uncharacterized protein n=1 Tax=Pleuronectes platessa TaxID=8262 RepID=A0A9N7VI72_PLEPL|nr:unnamed protein product [Pleuronectes platessa]